MLDRDDEQLIRECKEAGAILVTWDRVVRSAAGGVTLYEVMDHAGEAGAKVEGKETEEGRAELSRLRKLTPAQLTVMANNADKTWQLFNEHIQMTREAARVIRQLRVEQDYSWRSISRFCSGQWRAPWGGNQIAGMVICDKAAKALGEDFMQPPWN